MDPYIITVASEKGGVGKTTLATNLAIYLKALVEDLPVVLFSFDNHFSVDKMFRIGSGTQHGTVADLFSGRRIEELSELGQNGVEFIPSNRELNTLRDTVTVEHLAGTLRKNRTGGIIIIDTRPDLDIFTKNALYVADRVIIPVKDTASLENSRYIVDFVNERGAGRKTTRILPCLVDSRIHFKGPFKNALQLLRGYAINRGYRCYEGHIAKSSKVESLNTNPEGRIFPVIHHARNTEVHLQFAHLARQIIIDIKDAPERRIQQLQSVEEEQHLRRDHALQQQISELVPICPLCSQQLVNAGTISDAGYFWSTHHEQINGYAHDACLTSLLSQTFYPDSNDGDALRALFHESTRRDHFILQRTQRSRNYPQQELACYRFDPAGQLLSQRVTAAGQVHDWLRHCFGGNEERVADGFIYATHCGSDLPEETLYPEAESDRRELLKRIETQLL